MAEYNTEQRRVILEFMKEHNGLALSADGWKRMLGEAGYSLGRTTLYRTLVKLDREGAVISTREHRHTKYQYVDCCHEHLHLKCTGCGRLFHLSHEHSHAIRSSLPAEFSVNNVIYGICTECK